MEAQLRAGLGQLGLDLQDGQIAQLIHYAALLQKWGKVYNLTALLVDEAVVTHHLLDSLAVIRSLRQVAKPQTKLLDVGSGGGLPGVVIAIACPDLVVDCVDAVAKKAAFVQQVAGTLRLPNLRGLHGRVEKLTGEYDVVASRAFSSLGDFVGLTRNLVREGGAWMAMKGRHPADEIAQLPPDVVVFHVEQLKVPGLEAERCLVWLRRSG